MSLAAVTPTAQTVPGDSGRIRVLALCGSINSPSTTESALRIAAAAAGAAGAEVEILRGAQLSLPLYDPRSAQSSPAAQSLVAAVRRADALLIASPAYHHGVTGLLKNALDHLEALRDDPLPYLDGKAVGCIALAGGWPGAVNTVQGLRHVVQALRGWATPLAVAASTGERPFDGADCRDDKLRTQLELIGRQVVEFARMRRTALAPGHTRPHLHTART
ncbi:NAD(P)H-dependent oxidoreductase [Streptomyces sp. NPDC006251]|uniref:NADPH-dependent FMN reductase n=1 Tax=Streptomyces sp. NPDC006251 TaxID=3155718 RepID=UPI0033AC30CE